MPELIGKARAVEVRAVAMRFVKACETHATPVDVALIAAVDFAVLALLQTGCQTTQQALARLRDLVEECRKTEEQSYGAQ